MTRLASHVNALLREVFRDDAHKCRAMQICIRGIRRKFTVMMY